MSLDATVPITTTTTTTPITQTTTSSSSSTTISTTTGPNKVCDVTNQYYFTGPPSGTANDIATAAACCDLCIKYVSCQAYTYFGLNQTCLVYDNAVSNRAACDPESQCILGVVGMYQFSLNLLLIL